MKDSEIPKVGDIFEMFQGSFSTCIITKVYDDEYVDAERVMMKIDGGSPSIVVERINRISMPNLRCMRFHTVKDSIENRNY